MAGRDDGGPPGEGRFAAAREDPHSLVWLLDADGSVSRAGETARSLVEGATAELDVPFWTTAWWADSAVRDHVERALDGEYVRFRASAAGERVDVVLRPVGDDGTVESVLAVGRPTPPGADRRAKLAALHDVATRLETATDVDAVNELVVDAATGVLGFERCYVGSLAVETVTPEVLSPGLDAETAAGMDLGGWLAGRVLGEDEAVRVDDCATAPADAVPDGEHAAWLGVPIDRTTLLVAAAPEPGAFDETDRELADVLAAHAGDALRRVRHQRRLRQQNERLEEFASVVAHDLRNPLGAMRANLQVARELDDPEALDAIERSVDRMDELLADLLELASVGPEASDPEDVQLGATAEAAWETAAPAEATLTLAGDVAFEADRSRLRELLENLFDNAVEHGDDDVAVDVGVIDARGFYVADDGPGIPADERDSVFEHGFTTADDGTGFGLSIVRRIAETHGWSAAVTESEAGGARFEFTGIEPAEPDAD